MRKAKVDAQRCHPFAEKHTALVTMCKAMPESQRLLTIGASKKLAPILEMNRIDV